MRRLVILSLACLCVAAAIPGQAQAAAKAAGAETETDGGQYVDISPVAMPVIYQRQLVNYVFVAVRINLTPNANATPLREKEPYFRDALVKLGHRRPFTRLDDFTTLDVPALRAAMTAEAVRIAGPRQVANVQVMSQTAKRRSGLPRPPQARAPGPPAAAH